MRYAWRTSSKTRWTEGREEGKKGLPARTVVVLPSLASTVDTDGDSLYSGGYVLGWWLLQ